LSTVCRLSISRCCVLRSAHMQDLQEITHEVHYENFRSEKMAAGGAARRIKWVWWRWVFVVSEALWTCLITADVREVLMRLGPPRRALTLWRPLLPYGYSYKASCARLA